MNRREHERMLSDVPAVCRAPATPRRVRLVDVSRTGCRIRALDGAEIPYGATVLLDFMTGQRVSGQVMWNGPHTAGIRFENEISHEVAVAVGLEEAKVLELRLREKEAAYVPPRHDSSLAHWLRRLLRRAA